jgi:hypothetical protein
MFELWKFGFENRYHKNTLKLTWPTIDTFFSLYLSPKFLSFPITFFMGRCPLPTGETSPAPDPTPPPLLASSNAIGRASPASPPATGKLLQKWRRLRHLHSPKARRVHWKKRSVPFTREIWTKLEQRDRIWPISGDVIHGKALSELKHPLHQHFSGTGHIMRSIRGIFVSTKTVKSGYFAGFVSFLGSASS